LKNFTLSLNEATKTHYFYFQLLVQRSAVEQKPTTLPNTNAFSTLCVQSLCFLFHNNFLVFNISDNCRNSSHNQWTLPNYHSWSLEGLDFRTCYRASAQTPATSLWKPNVLGKPQESVS